MMVFRSSVLYIPSSRVLIKSIAYSSLSDFFLPAIPSSNSGFPSDTYVAPNYPEKTVDDFLKINCRSGDINLRDALCIFDYMLSMRPLPTISSFNALFGALAKIKHYLHVGSLCRRIVLVGLLPDYITLNILLKCFCNLNRTCFGFAILGTILKRGYYLRFIPLIILMNGLFKENKSTEATVLFAKMAELGIQPTYDTLIKGFCRIDNVHSALQIHEKMVNGILGSCSICEPNLFSYNTLIHALCKASLIAKAFAIFSEMKVRGISPNVSCYNSLIRVLLNAGRNNDAKVLFNEMKNQGMQPDVIMYGTFINALCNQGKVDEAKMVFESMIQRGEIPNIIIYNTLISGLCLRVRDRVDEASDIFFSLNKKGIRANVVSYTILIAGHCKHKRMDEALKLFAEMISNGIQPNIQIYNNLLNGFFLQGKVTDAYQLLEKMKGCGLRPNSKTFDILFEGLCKNNFVSEAVEFFHALKNSKSLGRWSLFRLIDGLCRDGKPEIAADFLCLMSRSGLKHGAGRYNKVIHELCKLRQLEKAYDIFQELKKTGFDPNDSTYNVLLSCFCKKNDTLKVVELLSMMEEKHLSPDASVVSVVGDLLSRDTEHHKYLKLLPSYQAQIPDTHGYDICLNTLNLLERRVLARKAGGCAKDSTGVPV